MEKKISYSGVVITVLVLAVLVMSIGFAAFSANIQLNGTAQVSNSKWHVYLDDSTYEKTVGSVEPTEAPDIQETSMTYSVNLTKPGDFYEFTIHVKNDGTFDANLTGITMSSIAEHQNYLKYTVTYDGTEYNTTTSSLSLPLVAETGDKEVKVRVEYVQPSDATQLPSDVKTVTLNATLNYAQDEA